MKNEAVTELIEQIKNHHAIAEQLQSHAVDGIQSLINARIEVATLAEAAKSNLGSFYHTWWRDNGLPDGWSHKYIRIAKTSKRLNLSDLNQMKLIGILSDEDEEDEDNRNNKHEPNPYAWVKLAGKLRSLLTTDHIKTMDRSEKENARLHLKPMVDLYNALL